MQGMYLWASHAAAPTLPGARPCTPHTVDAPAFVEGHTLAPFRPHTWSQMVCTLSWHVAFRIHLVENEHEVRSPKLLWCAATEYNARLTSSPAGRYTRLDITSLKFTICFKV